MKLTVALSLLFVLFVRVTDGYGKSAVRDAQAIERLLIQWRVAEARDHLSAALSIHRKSRRLAAAQAAVLLHEGHYFAAEKLLLSTFKVKHSNQAVSALRRHISDAIAATAAQESYWSPNRNFLLRIPSHDRLVILPLAIETLQRIRSALSKRLEHYPQTHTVVEFRPNATMLARGLPITQKDVLRNGITGACYYNRITVLLPSSRPGGYRWRDGLAHEYVHLVVNQLSYGRAPIWLQEGLAGLLEHDWYDHGESVGRSLHVQRSANIVAQALSDGSLIPWNKMSPSVAKLPNERSVELAYAQSRTAAQFLLKHLDFSGIRRLLVAVRNSPSIWSALRKISSLSRREFTSRWKNFVKDAVAAALTARPSSREPVARKPLPHSSSDYFRLAALLKKQNYTKAALVEIRKSYQADPSSTRAAQELAMAYLNTGQYQRSIDVLYAHRDMLYDSSAALRTLGLAALNLGSLVQAKKHLQDALSIDPYDADTRCALVNVFKADERKKAQHICRLVTSRALAR